MMRKVIFPYRQLALLLLLMILSEVIRAEEDKGYSRMIKQLQLLESQIFTSKDAQKLQLSKRPQVKLLLMEAEDLYHMAKINLQHQYATGADFDIKGANRAIQSAYAKAIEQQGSTPLERTRYQEQLTNIASMEKAIYMNPDIRINRSKINRLKFSAAQRIKRDNYHAALELLDEAYQITVNALSSAYQNKTFTYFRKFDSLKDEYEYEKNHYKDRQKLVSLLLDSV